MDAKKRATDIKGALDAAERETIAARIDAADAQAIAIGTFLYHVLDSLLRSGRIFRVTTSVSQGERRRWLPFARS